MKKKSHVKYLVELSNNRTVIPILIKFSQRVHTSLKTYK